MLDKMGQGIAASWPITIYKEIQGSDIIKVDQLTTTVYEYISNKIQVGEYKPNQRVTENEICNALGVSRTPAREALTRLAGENLLEKIPNKGFIVKEFQEKEKLDTYTVIGVLDALAGELSLESLSENEIKKMEELLEMMEISIKYKNYESYLSISNEFHNVYRAKCKNKVLLNVINSLVYNFIPKSYISEDKEDLFKMLSYSNKEHVKLIQGMKEKDKSKVNMILKKHWDTVSINEMI